MTGTDLATTTRTDLTIASDQQGWTDDQLAVLRQLGTEKATPADLKVFFHQCVRTGLDPFSRQVYMVEYGGQPTIQVGIDGFRVVARRSADKANESLEYEPIEWCGRDGVWSEVWLGDGPPAAARVTVLRDGKRFPATVLFSEYVGRKKVYVNRQWTGDWEVNSMWSTKPAHMLGKCVEAAALRKAYPHDLGGVYEPAEMDHRATVEGELVVEQVTTTNLPAVLELVAAATTRDELVAIWDQFARVMTVSDRARLQAACSQAQALQDEAEPVTTAQESPAADQTPDPAADPLREALVAVGYIEDSDQVMAAGRILSQSVESLDSIGEPDRSWLADRVGQAASAADPMAALDDLFAGITG